MDYDMIFSTHQQHFNDLAKTFQNFGAIWIENLK